MQEKEVRAHIRAWIARQIGQSEYEIADDSDLSEALGVDSLDLVELITMAEERYGLSISDEEGMTWTSIDEIVASLMRIGGSK